MVFKRREKRGWGRWVLEGFWPKGGWGRAAYYIRHRLSRLPDAPHRIARGIFAGVFISFTPLFGLHFLGAAAIAWIMRGNILAALIATFVGNPITTPVIAATSVEFGKYLLGQHGEMRPLEILLAFGHAGSELWRNITAIFDHRTMHWDRLEHFFDTVYLPYLIGGIIPGIVVSLAFYYISLPIIGAYQNLRKKKLRDKLERRIAAREAAAAKAAAEARADKPV